MEKLVKTRLFGLLTESSPVSNEEMQTAYEDFMKEVLLLNQSETDYQTVFRSLNLTRIEFKALQTQILYGQGGKCV